MLRSLCSAVALLAVASGAAQAAPLVGSIFAPVSGVVDQGGPGVGSIDLTFNQSGLSAGYTAGTTNFDTYIAGNPKHSPLFLNNEWFSNEGINSAQVTYDLGETVNIDRLALWNEESSGIGLLAVLVSTDGVAFTAILNGVVPTNNSAAGIPTPRYAADIFSFASVAARYVRFDMSECPQLPYDGVGQGYEGCAIGEVAFRAAQRDGGGGGGNEVSEPATLALVGAGLLGLAAVRRRKA